MLSGTTAFAEAALRDRCREEAVQEDLLAARRAMRRQLAESLRALRKSGDEQAPVHAFACLIQWEGAERRLDAGNALGPDAWRVASLLHGSTQPLSERREPADAAETCDIMRAHMSSATVFVVVLYVIAHRLRTDQPVAALLRLVLAWVPNPPGPREVYRTVGIVENQVVEHGSDLDAVRLLVREGRVRLIFAIRRLGCSPAAQRRMDSDRKAQLLQARLGLLQSSPTPWADLYVASVHRMQACVGAPCLYHMDLAKHQKYTFLDPDAIAPLMRGTRAATTRPEHALSMACLSGDASLTRNVLEWLWGTMPDDGQRRSRMLAMLNEIPPLLVRNAETLRVFGDLSFVFNSAVVFWNNARFAGLRDVDVCITSDTTRDGCTRSTVVLPSLLHLVCKDDAEAVRVFIANVGSCFRTMAHVMQAAARGANECLRVLVRAIPLTQRCVYEAMYWAVLGHNTKGVEILAPVFNAVHADSHRKLYRHIVQAIGDPPVLRALLAVVTTPTERRRTRATAHLPPPRTLAQLRVSEMQAQQEVIDAACPESAVVLGDYASDQWWYQTASMAVDKTCTSVLQVAAEHVAASERSMAPLMKRASSVTLPTLLRAVDRRGLLGAEENALRSRRSNEVVGAIIERLAPGPVAF